jgi:hypothetical protein
MLIIVMLLIFILTHLKWFKVLMWILFAFLLAGLISGMN